MAVDKIALRLIIGGDAKGAKKALGEIEKSSGGLGKALKTAQTGAAVGLAAIVGISVKGVQSYEGLTQAVAGLQRQSKISATDASLLVGQWQRYGVSIEAGSRATMMLSKQIDAANQGVKPSIESFKRLGISMYDLKTQSPAQILEQVRQKLSAMPPSAARTSLSAKLLGRGFQTLSKWIAASTTDLDSLNTMLKDTGQVMNEAELAKAKDDLKQMALLQVQWRGIMVTIGRSVMPFVMQMTSGFSTLLRVAAPLAPALKYVAGALAAFLIVSKISQGINAMSTALTTLRGAALATRGALAGRFGGGTAMGPAGTIGAGAKPLGGAGASNANTAAEQRNTAATNANTAAQQRSTRASNLDTSADQRSTAASNMDTAADRRSAAASNLAGTRIGGMGTKAKGAAAPIGAMGTASGRAKGSILGMDKSAVKSIAAFAALAVAVTFTMNQLSKLGNAIDSLDAAAKQAGQARTGADNALDNYMAKVAAKYGKDSPEYRKALEYEKQQRAAIARDAYKKPWWATAASRTKGGISSAWNFAFGGGQATGGDYMVTRPTMFIAGEAGPERATFTPKGKAGGGGVTVNVNIGNVHGTDGATANAFANKVADIVARRQHMAMATGF